MNIRIAVNSENVARSRGYTPTAAEDVRITVARKGIQRTYRLMLTPDGAHLAVDELAVDQRGHE